MRLIDADTLMNDIKSDAEKTIDEGDNTGSFWLGYIAGLVSVQPTVQPKTKEGHWILRESYYGDEQYECSQCGVIWEFSDGAPKENDSYYCPHCGAKMKGVKDD